LAKVAPLRLILRPQLTKLNQGQIQGEVTWQLYAISVARDQALVTMSLTQSAVLAAVGIQIFKEFALSLTVIPSVRTSAPLA